MSATTSKVATSAETSQSRIGVFSAPGIVLLLVCVMYALTYIDRINVSTPRREVFQKVLNLSNTQVGNVFSAFAYFYLAFQVVGGWVCDRFGARRVLVASAIIWGGSTLLTGISTGFWTMIMARVLLGFGEGAAFPTATRAMSDWMPAGKRAYAQGVTHCFARIGTAPNASAGRLADRPRQLALLVLRAGSGEPDLGGGLGILFPRQSGRTSRRDLRRSCGACRITSSARNESRRPCRGCLWRGAWLRSRSSTSAMAGLCGFTWPGSRHFFCIAISWT